MSTATKKLSSRSIVGAELRCWGPAFCASENSPCSEPVQPLMALSPRSSTPLSAKNIPRIPATIMGNAKSPEPSFQVSVGTEVPIVRTPICVKNSCANGDEGALVVKSVIEGQALTSHGAHKMPNAICETVHRTGSEPAGPWVEALPPPCLSRVSKKSTYRFCARRGRAAKAWV